MSLSPAKSQEGDHILDLLGGQDRLAAPGGADAGQPVDPIIGRHDRCRVEPGGVDEAQPQLPSDQRDPRPCRSGASVP